MNGRCGKVTRVNESSEFELFVGQYEYSRPTRAVRYTPFSVPLAWYTRYQVSKPRIIAAAGLMNVCRDPAGLTMQTCCVCILLRYQVALLHKGQLYWYRLHSSTRRVYEPRLEQLRVSDTGSVGVKLYFYIFTHPPEDEKKEQKKNKQGSLHMYQIQNTSNCYVRGCPVTANTGTSQGITTVQRLFEDCYCCRCLLLLLLLPVVLSAQ